MTMENGRLHSACESLDKKLSLVKLLKEKNNSEDEGEGWFHTWPERCKDKSKSPKKLNPAVCETDSLGNVNASVNVDVLLNQLPIAYDPITKRLVVSKPKVPKEEPLADLVEIKGHKRQPSELSDISNADSELQRPLVKLNSNPQSYTSLSSLSNYSSSTDFTDPTNSLERTCQPPPRFALASLWQKTFSRKSDDGGSSWRIFNRGNFFQRSNISGRSSTSSLNSGSSPTSTLRSVGSSGLILESRPSFLPAKRPEEALHHQLLHQKLFREAQKKENIIIQESERQREELCRHEEQIAQATRIWLLEILPQWETSKKLRKTRDLWWQGLPPSVRGQVWKLSIANDLNVTPELFNICLDRAREKLSRSNVATGDPIGLEDSVDVIRLDLSRTFPHLGIFQERGPLYSALDDLLSAYVCFRPDIGYVQGMSFVAATLLLNLDVANAFVSFANLLNRPLLHAFFRLDQGKMGEYYSAFETLLKSHLPKLHQHMNSFNLSADLYLQEWIYTLFSRSLPLDLASRVWDLICRDGDDFVFRTALGILKMYEPCLLEMDFIHAAQFLTNLPEDINGTKLFKSIEQIHISGEKSRFSQILTHHLAKVKGHT